MVKKSFIERMLDKILSVKWPSPEGHFLTSYLGIQYTTVSFTFGKKIG